MAQEMDGHGYVDLVAQRASLLRENTSLRYERDTLRARVEELEAALREAVLWIDGYDGSPGRWSERDRVATACKAALAGD